MVIMFTKQCTNIILFFLSASTVCISEVHVINHSKLIQFLSYCVGDLFACVGISTTCAMLRDPYGDSEAA